MKKGAHWTLIGIILGLFILVSLIFMGSKLTDSYKDSKQKRICKEAVRINSATRIKGDDSLKRLFISPESDISDVPCPVQYKDLAGNDNYIKTQLALMMYDSWDMMHKGELELFSGKSGSDTYCILTHHIRFGNDAKGKQITGFPDYLEDNEIPIGKQKYSEFLQCFNPTPELFSGTSDPAQAVIDTNEDYGIMFLYSKKGYLHKVWTTWTGSKIGVVVGVVTAGVLMLVPDVTITKATALMIIATQTGAGATGGYLVGSDKSADWQACVMLFPYSTATLDSMDCTYMAGEQGNR